MHAVVFFTFSPFTLSNFLSSYLQRINRCKKNCTYVLLSRKGHYRKYGLLHWQTFGHTSQQKKFSACLPLLVCRKYMSTSYIHLLRHEFWWEKHIYFISISAHFILKNILLSFIGTEWSKRGIGIRGRPLVCFSFSRNNNNNNRSACSLNSQVLFCLLLQQQQNKQDCKSINNF